VRAAESLLSLSGAEPTMPVNPIQQALSEVEEALEQREPERAWAALAPFAPSIDADAELALAWLTLLRITPGRDGLRAQVQRILARWPNEPRVVMTACDALVRAAELKAPDEPPQADGPAAGSTGSPARP
jgi:hypothetical protein